MRRFSRGVIRSRIGGASSLGGALAWPPIALLPAWEQLVDQRYYTQQAERTAQKWQQCRARGNQPVQASGGRKTDQQDDHQCGAGGQPGLSTTQSAAQPQ